MRIFQAENITCHFQHPILLHWRLFVTFMYYIVVSLFLLSYFMFSCTSYASYDILPVLILTFFSFTFTFMFNLDCEHDFARSVKHSRLFGFPLSRGLCLFNSLYHFKASFVNGHTWYIVTLGIFCQMVTPDIYEHWTNMIWDV